MLWIVVSRIADFIARFSVFRPCGFGGHPNPAIDRQLKPEIHAPYLEDPSFAMTFLIRTSRPLRPDVAGAPRRNAIG